MKLPVPYARQEILDEDVHAVVRALRSDFLTQGPAVAEFENVFSDYTGSRYAVAVSSGTAALHLSALCLGVTSGTNVITSPLTFSATANCIEYCGGNVFFCDIDPVSFLIDLDKLEFMLESHPPGFFHGVIPVDFAGRAVDLERLARIARKYGLWIIEDACHAPGGYFIDSTGEKQCCGNGKFADVSIFSFHPVKHIATGEGGMITTDSEALYQKLLSFRTHGITKNPDLFTNSLEIAYGSDIVPGDLYPGWYMEMQNLGYNYRLTDIQAELGLSQLSRAKQGLLRRKEIAAKYDRAFESLEAITVPVNVEGHAYHLYVVLTEKRSHLYNFLSENQIHSQVHYLPVHLMPYYRNKGFMPGDFPEVEHYYSRTISIPMFPSLREDEQEYVIQKVRSFYEQ
jgi:UDP-4-amino-4,6-dideoxy-N-acetyl-beta-L-altrosamine transaminase